MAVIWAMPRNVNAQLYVTNRAAGGNGLVREYNATTGTAISATFITGLTNEIDFGLAVSGNTLFVTNKQADSIGEYNTTTGAVINASFITGLAFPYALAVSGNNLYVTNNYAGSTWVGEYNATTAATINSNFIPPTAGLNGSFGLAVLGNNLYVSNGGGTNNGEVAEFNATSGP